MRRAHNVAIVTRGPTRRMQFFLAQNSPVFATNSRLSGKEKHTALVNLRNRKRFLCFPSPRSLAPVVGASRLEQKPKDIIPFFILPLTPRHVVCCFFVTCVLQQNPTPGNHGNAGIDPSEFKCELDPKLTEQDLPFFIPDIQGTWGSACGRNRGVFILDPPDGHTYGERYLSTQRGKMACFDSQRLCHALAVKKNGLAA